MLSNTKSHLRAVRATHTHSLSHTHTRTHSLTNGLCPLGRERDGPHTELSLAMEMETKSQNSQRELAACNADVGIQQLDVDGNLGIDMRVSRVMVR